MAGSRSGPGTVGGSEPEPVDSGGALVREPVEAEPRGSCVVSAGVPETETHDPELSQVSVGAQVPQTEPQPSGPQD